MRVTVWGARGAMVAIGAQFQRHGGDTSCVEVQHGDTRLVLDLGTGAIALGRALVAGAAGELGVFLSHTHIDHTMGLPFFLPALSPGWRISIFGPAHCARELSDVLDGALNPNYSPLYGLGNLAAQPAVRSLADEQVSFGPALVTARWLPHGRTRSLGYRVELGGKRLAYLTDVDYEGKPTAAAVDLARDADLLIHDAMNNADEHLVRRGWGHSRAEDAVRVADRANVKRLLLTHHDPWRDDAGVDALVAAAQSATKITVASARSGETHDL